MPLDRVTAEKVLVGADMLGGRLGRRAVYAKLYVVTDSTIGSIPAVGAMLTEGLASLGIYPSDPNDPTDTELGQVGNADRQKLFDIAELRGLWNIIGNLDEVDAQDGTDRREFTTFAEHLRKRATDLQKRCEDLYKFGQSAPTMSTINLEFQESGDALDWDWPL